MKGFDFSAPTYLGEQLHTADTHLDGDRPERQVNLDTDVVIVGAGPGGLCAAVGLVEAGVDVVILEAGQFWRPDDFVEDINVAHEHLYEAGGQQIMRGNVFIPLASGRGVGGGTLVNSAICFPTPDRVLDEWVAQWGANQWRSSERDALFGEVNQTIGVVDTDPAIAGGNSEVARRGFSELDVDHGYMPRNAGECVGCGTCQTGCPSGGKASADLNWLPRVLRAGGSLYADTRVDHIVVDGRRACGVRGRMSDPKTGREVARVDVDADRVILACGAINSPLLLQRQGLANSSGAVGRHLHVHPAVPMMAMMPREVRIWQGATQGYYARHPDDPDVLVETYSAPPDALLTQSPAVGRQTNEFLRNLRYVAGCGSMIRDASCGRVSPKSNGQPAIHYSVAPADTAKFRRGMELSANMFFAAGAREVLPQVAGAEFNDSLADTLDVIRGNWNASELTLYASHPLGTCRMHPDPKVGVVRPEDGMTHDIDHLHITDASVFPTAMGANPQVTIMANALAMGRNMAEAH